VANGSCTRPPHIWIRGNTDPVFVPSESPYSTNHCNPIIFSDPLGDFGSRKEARDYKKSHDVNGKISRNKGGSYSINDKDNGTYYEYGAEHSLNNSAKLEKPPTAAFMFTAGSTSYNAAKNGPTAIASVYGNKTYYNSSFWDKGRSFPFVPDEPNSFIQAQWRIGGSNNGNFQGSLNWFKQKFDGSNGFKIEAPTATHFALGKNLTLLSINRLFALSFNYSIGIGPEWGKIIDNGNESANYSRIGWGASAIGRFDFNTLNNHMRFFIATTLHHLQTDEQHISTGTVPSESIGSIGVSIGFGTNLGR
jgi:hypothetical protein